MSLLLTTSFQYQNYSGFKWGLFFVLSSSTIVLHNNNNVFCNLFYLNVQKLQKTAIFSHSLKYLHLFTCDAIGGAVHRTADDPPTLFFGMAAMPFLCRGVCFLPKLSYHRIISLAVHLPLFYFSFYQNTNFHLYKWARLPLLLLTFSIAFFCWLSFLIFCHNMFQFL